MGNEFKQRPGLTALCLGCLVLLVPATLAFLVNLEMALRVFLPHFHLVSAIFPARLFQAFVPLSADLSTVSTFVPVLLLVFPLVQGFRVLRYAPANPAFVRGLTAMPYPTHFAFFLVMLGLVGTLYGLLIGLNVSGVSNIVGTVPSADAIQQTLNRLMDGTATAILSSLVGIIAAFFVAKPIPWLFRNLTGIEEDEEEITLSQTLEHLTRDLQYLSEASRRFAEQLQPPAVEAFFQRLDALTSAVSQIGAKQDAFVQGLQRLEQEQQQTNRQLKRLETLEGGVALIGTKLESASEAWPRIERQQLEIHHQLQRLEALESAIKAGGAKTDVTNDLLQRLLATTATTHAVLQRNLEEQQLLQQNGLEKMAAMIDALREINRFAESDREAMRRAFSVYAQAHDK